jgi:chromosome segregation ATPase
MPTVEERISAVEAKVDAIAELRTDMNRQFSELRTDMNQQFSEVRSDMNRQLSEVRSDMDQLTRRVDVLDQRMERHFMWMVGIQFTVLIAVIVALIETSAR